MDRTEPIYALRTITTDVNIRRSQQVENVNAKCLLPEVWKVSAEAFTERMEIKPVLANIASNI